MHYSNRVLGRLLKCFDRHAFMHRIDLIELLTRHARERGVVILAGASLESILEDSDSITAKLQGGKLLTADLLIGADGKKIQERETYNSERTELRPFRYHLQSSRLDSCNRWCRTTAD